MLPQEFAAWRERHRLTQGQAAQYLGRSIRSVNAIENGPRDTPINVETALACELLDLRKMIEAVNIAAHGTGAQLSTNPSVTAALNRLLDQAPYVRLPNMAVPENRPDFSASSPLAALRDRYALRVVDHETAMRELLDILTEREA